MTERKILLQKLLDFGAPVPSILESLRAFGWDSEQELVILSRKDIIHVATLYLHGTISANDVEQWANAIEGREDIGFENYYDELIREIIFDLANPDLSKPLSTESAKSWILQLSQN